MVKLMMLQSGYFNNNKDILTLITFNLKDNLYNNILLLYEYLVQILPQRQVIKLSNRKNNNYGFKDYDSYLFN